VLIETGFKIALGRPRHKLFSSAPAELTDTRDQMIGNTKVSRFTPSTVMEYSEYETTGRDDRAEYLTSRLPIRLEGCRRAPPTPVVPPAGALFLWTGLNPASNRVNFLPSANGVLQPALSWGTSCARTPAANLSPLYGSPTISPGGELDYTPE
jgi:hypothetical protein